MTKRFQPIYELACKNHGGEAAMLAKLPDCKSPAEIAALSDDRFLAAMTQQVFSAGFSWKVVEKKMPQFEEVFWGFDIDKIAYMPPEMLEEFKQDKRIIRNMQKIKAIYGNALFIRDIQEEHGSFAAWIAGWPSDNIIALWEAMKKRGSRLGGVTGPVSLRRVGKDTWLASADVLKALQIRGVIDQPKATSKTAQKAIQEQMNDWHTETQLPFCQISRILSYSVG